MAQRFSRLPRVSRVIVLLVGAGWIVAGLSLETFPLPATHWRLDGAWLFVLGIGCAAGSWTLRRLSTQATVFAAVLSVAVSTALTLGYRPPARGDVAPLGDEHPRHWVNEHEWFELYTDCDERYGYKPRPGAVARHHALDFDVVYHLDANGWRQMPTPSQPPVPGEIAFIGCSFTFGFGVAEGQFYSAMLAAGPWRHRKVTNYSAVGWGTGHAALVVDDLLARSEPPACIFYGWLTKHHMRNERRRTIREAAACPFPLFEERQGKLEYLGLVPVSEATAEDGPALVERERRISRLLLQRMHAACLRRGVPLVVLVLEREIDPVIDAVTAAAEMNVVDLSRVSHHYFAHDDHPSPLWHRRVARAIARQDDIARLVGDSRLYQPDAIARVEEPWGMSLDRSRGADARLQRLEGSPTRVRVVPTTPTEADGGVEIDRRMAIAGGAIYRFSARLRSQQPRRVKVYFGQAHPPWKTVAPVVPIEVGTQWTQVNIVLPATEDCERGKLAILLENDRTSLEITRSRLVVHGHDIFGDEPPVDFFPARDSAVSAEPRISAGFGAKPSAAQLVPSGAGS